MQRKKHSAEFKAKIALEALKNLRTINEIASEAQVHPTQAGASKYPYLLRGKVITAPNQVWSTDITYIPLPHGYLYLVAVIDWYSRYVLSWELSNTMDVQFCMSALEKALGIDTLKYEFALTPQTQVVIAANAGASDDFTDTINPYFDGDGASGSISAFGNRPSIYYTVGGVGVGIRHKFSDSTELSLGYLANDGQTPAAGSGLFGGGYGAIAQLTFKTGENSKVGVTYTRTMNAEFGTGSNNANVNASGLSGMSNNFGLQGSFQLSPEFALGGWAGYTQNQAAGGDRQIWNWAITAAAPDLGGKGNLAGFLVGQEPRVASSSDGTTDTKAGLHIEGFYQFKVSDSLSITPGIIYLTAPNQEEGRGSAVIGALRTTFTF